MAHSGHWGSEANRSGEERGSSAHGRVQGYPVAMQVVLPLNDAGQQGWRWENCMTFWKVLWQLGPSRGSYFCPFVAVQAGCEE